MRPIIRLARIPDAEALASLVELYWDFENLRGYDRPRILALLAEFLADAQRGHCWVAEVQDRLVGYALAVYVFSLEHGGLMAEIDELFVIPEKRGAKIGAALLSEATQAMARRGIAQVQLQLGIGNAGGKRFYERQGFRPHSGYELWLKPLRVVPPGSNQ
jgi:GNAT superfamily N-acetyltransferase